MKHLIAFICKVRVLGIILLTSSSLNATSYTWNGYNGNWSDPSKWIPNGVPGLTDDVTIPGGTTCTLDGDVIFQSLSISGGTLNGDFDITLTASLTCSGGTIAGIGDLIVNGATSLTTTYTSLFSRAVYINGGGSTTAAGRFYTHANCTLHLPAGQTFTMNTIGYTPWNGWPNNCIFYVDGTLIKNGPEPAHFLYQTFVTNGHIIINQGSIDWANGGTHSGADIAINGSASYLGLGGGTHSFTNCTFSGTGSVPIYGNANVSTFTGNLWSNTLHLRMHDGTMTLGQDLTLPTYRHLGGTLNGSGNLTVIDSVLISNGTIENTGTWNVGTSLTCSGGNLSGSGVMNVTGITRLINTTYLFYRTINMNGGGYTQDNGRFYTHGGCQLNLPLGKTFTILATGYAPWHGWANGGTINIFGTLIKNGAGQAHFVSPSVLLNGTIIINQGSIDLANSASHNGMDLSIYPGAYTTALNGSHTYTNCEFKGSGPYYAAPTATLIMSGTSFSPGIAGTGILKLERAGYAFPVFEMNTDVNTLAGPGIGHDKLEVIGGVNLNGGTLNVTDGGAPDGNYTVLSFTETRTGTFSVLNAPPEYSLIYDDVLKIVILNKSTPPDNDSDGYNASIDCNDSDPLIHPGATEICNSLDDDCDGLTDDADPGITGQLTWYADADNDGYGDASVSQLRCTQPSGYVANADDCNDTNTAIHPGATETCNETDDDCDGQTDEGVQNVYYEDADQDGYGNPAVSQLACSPPPGFTAIADDCNDLDGAVYPGATETCNLIDDDCDGYIDEDVLLTFYADNDGDTYGDIATTTVGCTPPSGYVDNHDDCDDTNAAIHPGAVEICNTLDDDCDGVPDDGVQSTFYADADGDGFGDSGSTILACVVPAGFVSNSLDCNDQNADIHPSATESCNLIDDDCNGLVDEDVQGTFYADSDGDGYGEASITTLACTAPSGFVANDDDCDDSNASIHPDALESCNEIDDDCDGEVDEGVQTLYYADADGDNYGNTTVSVWGCSSPSGYITIDGDCDDGNANVNPGAMEVCNLLDDDCDGLVDEGVQTTYYADSDGDGYGEPNETVLACAAPSGYVSNGDDCNDTNPNINPGAREECNETDDNCDGQVDEDVETTYYADTDEDGFGDPSNSILDCRTPAGYVDNALDCNDANPNINPSIAEICNLIDDDCDGMVDEGVLLPFHADQDGDGFGDAETTIMACVAPIGFVENNDDCDDLDASVHPGASEVCNEIDDDCDGLVDEDVQLLFYQDADEDGYGNLLVIVLACTAPSGYVSNNADCDDTNNNVHPGAQEICNSLDDNCNGQVDEIFDQDGDGYGTCNGDCNDLNSSIHPGAPELCNNLDDDCDGLIDEGVTDSDGDGICNSNDNCPYTYNPDQADNEHDGIGDVCDPNDDNDPKPDYNDCDPFDPTIYPGAPELCGDLIDNDCDNKIDDPLKIVLISEIDVLCHGDASGLISITGDCGLPPYSYQWNTGQTTSLITSLPAGTYKVTVTDAQGLTKQKTFKIQQPPALHLTLSKRDVSCHGNNDGEASVSVSGGNSPYDYVWSTGATTRKIYDLPYGSYSVTITDENGCTKIGQVTIDEPSLLDILNTETAPDPNHPGKYQITVTATGGTPYSNGYRYRRCNSSGNSCGSWQISNILTNLNPGLHLIKVKDANGCQDMLTVQIIPPAPLLIPEEVIIMESDHSIVQPSLAVDLRGERQNHSVVTMNLYPNPGRDILKVEWRSQQAELIKIKVYSFTGDRLIQKEYYTVAGRNTIDIDMHEIQAGVYLINVSGPHHQEVKTWIKMN